MKRLGRFLWCGVISCILFTVCGCPSSSAPGVMSLSINNGTTETTTRSVTLGNVCTGSPTYYIASESATFNETDWQAYAAEPTFTLAGGNGVKTVYFKVKNQAGASNVMTATITLNEASPVDPEPGETMTFAGIEFVWCPAGSFTMGSPSVEQDRNTSEGPQHQVTLSRGFLLSKYPCTQAQWLDLASTNPSYFQGSNANNADTDLRPVEQVSWVDVQSYITALNAAYPNMNFRLPTEAEWEYACRAGTTTRYYWGNDASYSLIDDNAWYYDNSSRRTHTVGTLSANAWGLYDMGGNVLNWVQDLYGTYTADAVTDPTGPTTGSGYVARGGCWYSEASACRSASRYSSSSDGRHNFIGFRLARYLDETTSTQPAVLSFTLNSGAVQTTSRTITLNNVSTGIPTEYMASESPTFNEATWQTYGENPTFTLAGGNGLKRVYFKVQNSAGESNVMSATLTLAETDPADPEAGETLTYAGIEFVWCPAGTFLMGSADTEEGRNPLEGPQHQVTLSKGFLIAKYPCTQSQWYEITGKTPAYFLGTVVSNADTDNFPVEQVSWSDVQSYITTLNTAYTGMNFRLPTEAEWEYACRAGTTTRFSWGDDLEYALLGDYAWFIDNSDSLTHTVGEKLSNPWGLYDMNGNVLNWVQDRFGSYSSSAATDPTGPTTGSLRVARGGCWYGSGSLCRSAIRYSNNPASNYSYIGFRLAKNYTD